MKISDRILELRRQKGISQEELADKLGVSRQAVSKWESEQSVPEMEKIIAMSEFFDVTTDYLLKGIEPIKENDKERKTGNVLSVLGPSMAWTGYITSCALWYEYQNAFAIMNGFVWMIVSAVIVYAAKLNNMIDQKTVNRCWMISFPAFVLFALSLLYNACTSRVLAPYPLLETGNCFLLLIWLLLLIGTTIAAEMILHKSAKQ